MIYILNYRGISIISKGIKFVTWGDFSHTAICNEHGITIEAWHHGGVEKTPSPWHNHKPNTEIIVYSLAINSITAAAIWKEAIFLVGTKYDFQALLGFIPVLRMFWKDVSTHWFCSHAVATACKRAGESLFSPQTKLYKVSPALIDTTPKLEEIGTVTNMYEFHNLINNLKGA